MGTARDKLCVPHVHLFYLFLGIFGYSLNYTTVWWPTSHFMVWTSYMPELSRLSYFAIQIQS